jgi:hypothetical protein
MQLPLNVSPVSASFFGLLRLGIHLVLCVACSFLTLSLGVFCLVFLMTLCFNSCLQQTLSKIEEIASSVGKVQGQGANPNL